MADDHQVTRVPVQSIEAQPRPRRAPDFPQDPDTARAEIEATRARMSDTLDEIEDVLLRKKATIRDRMDVMAPVREQPVRSMAAIFAAALVLGFLSARGKGGAKARGNHANHEADLHPDRVEHEDEDDQEEEMELAWAQAEAWEDRAHRLLRVARVQEAELDIHRSRRDSLLKELRSIRRREREEEEDDYEYEPNLFQRLRESATDRLATLAGEVSHRMMRGS